MKKLVKLAECEESFDGTDFSEPVKVQGGQKRTSGNLLEIRSGGRYKLFTISRDFIKIVEGNGHFKWARGETPFIPGDIFLAEEVGEYELNGAGVFLILRK